MKKFLTFAFMFSLLAVVPACKYLGCDKNKEAAKSLSA